jgi:alpha-glucosidase
MTLSNEGARSWIDFAATHNMQYLLFDWKWYGPALNFSSDATKVVVDLDLPGIIKYADSKGVGIFLYVNHQALQQQGDQLFPVYKSWGIKGVKFGFVETGSQHWNTWVHELVRKAADNQLLVNIHDEYRPTGYSRTYPNLITQEGIRGNEEMPDATHNTILPFTRGIAGAGDYTICYYSKRIKTTHAHQLALGVVYYSPLQTLFWYDKAADYHQEPEITFFEKLPTVWDDTHVIDGTPGQFVSIARRSGKEWFIGTITNNEARTVSIPLDFLGKGTSYQASIYEDDPQVQTATKVKITERRLKAGEVLTVKLSPSGGQAVWLRPVQ